MSQFVSQSQVEKYLEAVLEDSAYSELLEQFGITEESANEIFEEIREYLTSDEDTLSSIQSIINDLAEPEIEDDDEFEEDIDDMFDDEEDPRDDDDIWPL